MLPSSSGDACTDSRAPRSCRPPAGVQPRAGSPASAPLARVEATQRPRWLHVRRLQSAGGTPPTPARALLRPTQLTDSHAYASAEMDRGRGRAVLRVWR
jgi:hypothetical protein